MQTPSFSIENSDKSPTTAPYGNRDTQGNKHLKQVHLSDYRNVLTDHFSKPRTKSRATEWLIKPSLNADGVRHETQNANTQTKFKTHRPQRWNATKHTVEPVRSIIFSRPVGLFQCEQHTQKMATVFALIFPCHLISCSASPGMNVSRNASFIMAEAGKRPNLVCRIQI